MPRTVVVNGRQMLFDGEQPVMFAAVRVDGGASIITYLIRFDAIGADSGPVPMFEARYEDGPVGSVGEFEVFAASCSYGRRTPGCQGCSNRGQNTAPALEQLSAPVAAPGLVTMASPVADKLTLFADRFRARVDVYAVRWENTRTGAAGWMPAVAGGWRKGMDRRGAAYLPHTAEVVAAHLVGDAFMGLYPLLPGNTCHFVVADFDGPMAMLDALAYVKAARASAVPAALERYRPTAICVNDRFADHAVNGPAQRILDGARAAVHLFHCAGPPSR
jgi:hypothetical protein